MKFGLTVLAAASILAGCAVTPKEDPVQLRLDDLDSRVGRIDRIVSNQSLIQMAQRLDTLQDEIRSLRGRIEELQNENVKLRKEQRDLYADLDKRLSETATAASAAATAAAAAATRASAPTPAAADEQTQYSHALEELKARNYASAVEILRGLAVTFPNGALADNTQYWLGEAYYVTQEYDQAAAAFQVVISNWPNSRKVPDALLKLGYTQEQQNKLPAARLTLQQVIARYPDSDAAKVASERLAKLPKP
ncbi:MAG: tol-pal system protein YbgF [Steroidobacteraceae bacterium]